MRITLACVIALVATSAIGQVIYNSSSTAAEGYQRGLGAVISAQGERNLSNSQAAINLTDARSSQIDNQVKSVNAFWEKKDIYSERQQQELAEIDRKRQQYIAGRGPLDFSPDEFDRTNGQVHWPSILAQEQYNDYRTKLDELFHKRSYEGALTGEEYLAATTTIKDWRAALMQQEDQFPRSILQQMMRFLNKAKRELDDNLS